MSLMHITRPALIAAALTAIAMPSAAINKCNIDGRVVFQDTPCPEGTGGAITVRPASGSVSEPGGDPDAPSSNDSSAATAPSSSSDMRERAEALEKERKGREIDHQIKIVEQRIKGLERKQAAELAALSSKKQHSRNNLAGATWEASISQEQQAVMSRYESLMKNERSKIEQLIAQRARL